MADKDRAFLHNDRLGLPMRLGIGAAVGFGALASGFLLSRRGRRLVADTFKGMQRSPLADQVLDRIWGDAVLGRRRLDVQELPGQRILLTGAVANDRERTMAVEVVAEVPGVNDVEDRLVLDPALRRRRRGTSNAS